MRVGSKEYNERFEGHRPLMECSNERYPDRLNLKYADFEETDLDRPIDFLFGERVNKTYAPFVFGVKGSEEELDQYDFLNCYDGPAFVVHDRVLKIFKEMCPDDIQAFDAVIKNYTAKQPAFENHHFHLINVTHNVKALDLEKSKYRYSPMGRFDLKYRVFKDEPCMEGHLLARDFHTSRILFHPSLAKLLRKCKGVQFLRDEDSRF